MTHRRRSLWLRALATAAVLVAVGACSDGDSDAGDPPETTSTTGATPVTTGRPTATTAATTATTVGSGPTTVPASLTTVAGEVTIRGPVSAVFASARVLVFDPPVNGYSRAALTSDTEYRTADGSPGTLLDVTEGSVVSVTGEPGAPGALIARVVTVVG